MRIVYGFVAYIILDGQRIMMDHISSFQPLETQTLQNVDGTTALSKEFCRFICLSEIQPFPVRVLFEP